jgi:hypothetical protein
MKAAPRVKSEIVIPETPIISSVRRPARSSKRSASTVMPTLMTPTPTAARIAPAEESTPVNSTIVGA